jgi:microcystin-dependent protein
VEYPLLYDAIKVVFRIDDDTFFVPDLRNKFLLGEDEYQPMGSSGGEQNVTLDISEMPEHTHTNSPHAHSEIGAVSTIINGGLEAPASAATPLPTTTGFETVVIDNAGGGQAHNNMPPYVTIGYVIVAG